MEKSSFVQLAIIGVLCLGVVKCNNSAWYTEYKKNEAAQEKADETPHVIRTADGCNVYEFKYGGSFHLYTRCGETVTTERTYTESCGKACTRQKSEVIVTKGNK